MSTPVCTPTTAVQGQGSVNVAYLRQESQQVSTQYGERTNLADVYTFTAVPANGWVFDHFEIVTTYDHGVYVETPDETHTIETSSSPSPITDNPFQTLGLATQTTADYHSIGEYYGTSRYRTTDKTLTYTVTAVFTQAPTVYYQVTTSPSPANGGVTSGDGSYESSTPCTITATPNPGFLFDHWEINGSTVAGAAATYTFTVTGSANCVAFFEEESESSSSDSSDSSSSEEPVYEDGVLLYNPLTGNLRYNPETNHLRYKRTRIN